MSTASNSSLKQSCSALTSVTSALEVIFNVMHSINPRFTYLLTYLLTGYCQVRDRTMPFSKLYTLPKQISGYAPVANYVVGADYIACVCVVTCIVDYLMYFY